MEQRGPHGEYDNEMRRGVVPTENLAQAKLLRLLLKYLKPKVIRESNASPRREWLPKFRGTARPFTLAPLSKRSHDSRVAFYKVASNSPYRAINNNIGDLLNVVIQPECRPGQRFVSEALEIHGYDSDRDEYKQGKIFNRHKEAL